MNMRQFLIQTLMENQLSELEAEATLGHIETRIGRATLENIPAPDSTADDWKAVINQLLEWKT